MDYLIFIVNIFTFQYIFGIIQQSIYIFYRYYDSTTKRPRSSEHFISAAALRHIRKFMLFSTNTAGVFEKAESPETTEKEVRMEQEKVQRPLQWHPAFYADLQIELEAVKDNLICENEHQLGTKPMAIDVLIIKKQLEFPIRKNIGRIFRRYNVIEYKSPEDYIGIDDFYKVFAYA